MANKKIVLDTYDFTIEAVRQTIEEILETDCECGCSAKDDILVTETEQENSMTFTIFRKVSNDN